MRRSGFTLIELLVVIAIIGIVAAAVALSVSTSDSRQVQEETARLGALFRIAQDEVRITGRALRGREAHQSRMWRQSIIEAPPLSHTGSSVPSR